MTKNFLGSALSHWLLLNPTAETQGNAAPPAAKTPEAKPTAHLGMSAVDLVDAIEANPDAFATEVGDDEEDGASPNSETQKAEQAKADAAAAKKIEDDKAAKAKADADAKAKEAKGEEAKPVELNADQKAWLELRAAAKTAEEAAEIDKQAPTFTDAEWAQAEKTFTGENGENGEKPKADDVTAQLASVQTELATVKAKEEAASKRLKEVETELAAAKPLPVANVHPLFLADATELERAEQNAYALKKWAAENWDGSEAIAAAGEQPAVPAYTAAQVRKASANADQLLQQVIPAAREKLAAHISANSQTAQVYPELFNPQATPLQPNMATPYQAREMILRQLPGLRTAIPSINTVLGDAFVGEQLRVLLTSEQPTEDAKSLAAALVKAVPTLAKFMPALTAPGKTVAKAALKLPAKPIVPLARPGSAGGRALRPANGGKATGMPNLSKFVTQRTENGGDELSALTETLRNVNVG